MDDRAIGLIAGEGRLPLLVADGMRAAGARVCGVGLRDHFDPELPGRCDSFTTAGIAQIGRWISVLRRQGVARAVLVGRVAKARFHQPLRLLRQLPDFRTARVWFRRLGQDNRTAALLMSVAEEMRANGIILIDSTTYITGHLAEEGLMTAGGTSARQQDDISSGWPLLQRVVDLDIGQSIAVCGGRVIAVEGLEGTDAMIERAGTLNGSGWTLLKAPSRHHDMRFDVPAIGLVTIERMKRARAGCLALDAGNVIMIDKPSVIAAADEAGIPIIGVRVDHAPAPVAGHRAAVSAARG